eukprot:gene15898-7230_t
MAEELIMLHAAGLLDDEELLIFDNANRRNNLHGMVPYQNYGIIPGRVSGGLLELEKQRAPVTAKYLKSMEKNQPIKSTFQMFSAAIRAQQISPNIKSETGIFFKDNCSVLRERGAALFTAEARPKPLGASPVPSAPAMGTPEILGDPKATTPQAEDPAPAAQTHTSAKSFVSSRQLHPILTRMNELLQADKISETHPFFQEINGFSSMYGELSTDLASGFTDMFARFPAIMYLQEGMRDATSGKPAYNIYLGKHGVDSGIQPFDSQQAVLPPLEKLFHFGLFPASWSNKKVVPMVKSGMLVKFIEILLKLLPPVTAAKNVTDMLSVIYVALALDQKAVSPGAENFNDTIYGIQPAINAQEANELCKYGFSTMLKTLISRQLLDSLVAVPVACYHLEKTGEWEGVRERMKELIFVLVVWYMQLRQEIHRIEKRCVKIAPRVD